MAEIKDIPSLLKLWQEMMDHHKRIDKKRFQLRSNAKSLIKRWLARHINSQDSLVLKATLDKKLIGYCMGYIDQLPPVYKDYYYGYISDGIITKKYRKQGVMKSLIKEAAAFFKKRGLKRLCLKVNANNPTGIKAWSKIGFYEDSKNMFMDIK